jgi:2'-5' RNA ligase
MPKLFVALDLPPDVTAELALLQPPRTAGVRLARLGQNEGVVLPPVSVHGFSLYSTSLVADAPVYQREKTFPLVAVEDDAPQA